MGEKLLLTHISLKYVLKTDGLKHFYVKQQFWN